MNYHTECAKQNEQAALADFATFVEAFTSLPNPKFVPHFKHPQQVEETESY